MGEVLTAARMRGVETAAIARGDTTGRAMMEQAGEAVGPAILARWAAPGLGRVVDRWRQLQGIFADTSGAEHDEIVRELRVIDKRMTTIGRALLMLVLTALSIGATIVVLFVDEFMHLGLQPVAAATFIIGIGLLMWALVLFLRETQLAAEALRIPDNYLERDRKL